MCVCVYYYYSCIHALKYIFYERVFFQHDFIHARVYFIYFLYFLFECFTQSTSQNSLCTYFIYLFVCMSLFIFVRMFHSLCVCYVCVYESKFNAQSYINNLCLRTQFLLLEKIQRTTKLKQIF